MLYTYILLHGYNWLRYILSRYIKKEGVVEWLWMVGTTVLLIVFDSNATYLSKSINMTQNYKRSIKLKCKM